MFPDNYDLSIQVKSEAKNLKEQAANILKQNSRVTSRQSDVSDPLEEKKDRESSKV